MNNVKAHIVPIGDGVESFTYVSKKGVSHVFADLGGYFQWISLGESADIVDPKYFEEYKRSQLFYSKRNGGLSN